jgi:hypothetical protein
MQKHFGIPTADAGKFMDPIFIQLAKEVKLDVLFFDDWLHRQHGEYEADGLSMEEAIDKFYSVDATLFVKSFL